MSKKIFILGTRGIPASHGGFETFAEYLACYLQNNGWEVIVYCQTTGRGEITYSSWRGITLVHIPVSASDPLGTIIFDWKCNLHVRKHDGVALTLGYNTAIFSLLFVFGKIVNVFNMDGIEWKRQKWGRLAKIWFYLNEVAGSWLGKHLIADNPEIRKHLARNTSQSRITVIPYGADRLADIPDLPLAEFGVSSGAYLTLIARPEPENSVLELVTAFSAQPRGCKLLVLGKYTPESNAYHASVMSAASDEVIFAGAVYEKFKVQALRFHCLAYLHGHQVGGTNPSLVEAMGAGNAIIAHDNPFNRWVTEDAALYFDSTESAVECMDRLFADEQVQRDIAGAMLTRHEAAFTWDKVLQDYEQLLERYVSESPEDSPEPG